MIRVVNAIILNKDRNKFLVIKRKNEPIHPGKWTFPGGIVEQNETDEDALAREVREETGLEIKQVLKKIYDYEYPRPDGTMTRGVSYSIVPTSEIVTPNNEIEDFKWVTIEEFEDIDHVKGLDEEAMKALFEE
jgi:8-oxo-dGTP diphosphatase